MGKGSKSTVAAAQGRQGRDSKDAGAVTPGEKQQMVSMGLTEKAVSEGRDPGEAVGTALPIPDEDDEA